MVLKIGGDMLALDAAIRQQIEKEGSKLMERFSDELSEAQFNIQEEFDPLRGHRVRCELSAKLGSGQQMVMRETRKLPNEAITGVFDAAHQALRRLRRQRLSALAPSTAPVVAGAQIAR
ncbi:Fis family transcriptional regulator [Caldichromatium japonicum]|uniref:Fis family transcriptional regulator n=1 Tax=Caldichromatium japonicum TaxID=2699430 RepID=A0A6G7VAW5_9GAMM|nr:HPF/RaiA family ribosome-associated protein [Caldichromatium japonicum]QIK37092.1 Fis family transcriptional regulator [Caldichromatium japonicum]